MSEQVIMHRLEQEQAEEKRRLDLLRLRGRRPRVPTTTEPKVPTVVPTTTYTPMATTPARIEARGGYTLTDPERLRIEQRGGYTVPPPQPQDPLAAQYMEMYGVPYNPYTGPVGPWDEGQDPAAIEQQKYLEEATREIQTVKRRTSQYQGRAYYRGGSEQAYLGPVAQLEEFFFGTGERWQLGQSYRGIAPEDRIPPAFLSPSTVRIITKSGPSYREGVDYGPKVTMEDIGRLYDYDPVTGAWVLKQGAPAPPLSGGYDIGYGWPYGRGYGRGYGGGYGGGVGRGPSGFGLVHWTIR